MKVPEVGLGLAGARAGTMGTNAKALQEEFSSARLEEPESVHQKLQTAACAK